MISFEFYVNSYMGTAIPEKEFDVLAARATEALARMERIYRVQGTPVEHAMAVCAMAETLWHRRNEELFSPKTKASTRYVFGRKSLSRELYEKATIYLDIYRGVKV